MTTQTMTFARDSAQFVGIGERFGFYELMSVAPVTEAELMSRSGAPASLVRDWLANQTRDGYLVGDKMTGRYANWCSLPRAA